MGKKFNKNYQNRKKEHKPRHHHPFNNRKREDRSADKPQFTAKDNLKEDQVGITEYVNSGEGFKGIIKSRFSDFHVNEIDLNGDVLQLNDLTVPDVKEKELNTEEEVNSAKEELINVISEDVWKQIHELKEAKHDGNNAPEKSAIYIDVSVLDKEKRTQAHKVINKLYANKLVSSTVSGDEAGSTEPDKKFIRVMKSKGYDRNRWPMPKEYVHFLVHKENLDTSEVATSIAQKLRMKPSQVNYCGTKDKRAKTTQKFCIRKRNPRQIVGSVKFLNGVKIGNFKFMKNVLKLGDLHGNRFRIAIRNLSGERQHIETSLNNVKEQGFINYFGLQRFGNCSAVPTYDVGVALLKADYKLACELILKPRDNDIAFLKNIREMWWKNRDSKAAAAQFHSNKSYIEKKLLDGLAEFGEKDYAAALRKIPRNMLLLYPHAFQSLIFNNIASKRIKEFGLTLLPGDLVYRYRDYREIDPESSEVQEEEEENIKGLDEDDEEEQDSQKEQQDNKEQEEHKEEEGKVEEGEKEQTEECASETTNEQTSKENSESRRSIFRRKVMSLTAEDIASGAYTIYDMVLPLPGHDVTYPENIVGSWYKELMAQYELSSEKLKHNVKLFSMAGAYRRLVVKPRDLSWEFKSYSTPEETLILSDLELLQGKKLEDFQKVTSGPKHEALLLDFCLPTASYATMMLRELIKCDTSAAAQTLLQQETLNDFPKEIKNESQKEEESLGEKRKASDDDDSEKNIKVLKTE